MTAEAERGRLEHATLLAVKLEEGAKGSGLPLEAGKGKEVFPPRAPRKNAAL